MQVKNRLPGIRSCIENQAITALADEIILGQFPGHNHQVAEKLLIVFTDAVKGRDMPVWNDQQMNRGGRHAIRKCCDLFILVNDVGRHAPGHNLAKNTIFSHMVCYYYNRKPGVYGASVGIGPVRALQTIS